jgi:hypothetical protein
LNKPKPMNNSERLISPDTFRGMTIAAMILVNSRVRGKLCMLLWNMRPEREPHPSILSFRSFCSLSEFPSPFRSKNSSGMATPDRRF